MLCFAKMEFIEGLVPDDFKAYIENFDTAGIESNEQFKSGEKVAEDNGVDTIKVVVHAPWPVWDRIMFFTKYMELDVDGSHLMLTSTAGNQRYLDDPNIYTQEEKDNMVLGHVFFSGGWFQPVKDADGKTIGTRFLTCTQMEFGGSIPTWVQNIMGPVTAKDGIFGCIEWAKAKKAEKA